MSFVYPLPSAANLDSDDTDDDTNIDTNQKPIHAPVLPRVPARMSKKSKQQTPQEAIDDFWTKFTTKAPGKATTIIPHNSYVQRAVKHARKAGITTQASYEEAAEVCKTKVAKIVKECRRVNQKYRDPHFDLEWDLKWGKRDTLEALHNVKNPNQSEFKPKSVKRIPDIFDEPKFYIDGPTANDVRQGRDGDCWLMAALCTLSNKPSLIDRCCVARDEQIGVYGFVFHRDGEWISEIIDDKLFLTKPDFEESFLERMLWEDRERVESEEQYRRAYQSGSGALYFAQCVDANETWLPLLEKAYAKAHGDYSAIEGGFTGEGIEDLTGGVTSEIYTNDILDKEHFWKEELMKVNDEFLFGCSTGMWGIGWGERRGILELHAYSIMKATEIDGHRLLLLKNPWGKGEWKGAWSDGSKEWTAEWMTKLNHRFGDDGSFWISYEDLLRKYQAFDRTRLFSPEWKVTTIWTTLSIPWTLDYHDSQFAFSISESGPVVIVLSQLDDRYYRGLEGQYRFTLNFRLHKSGQEDYVVRSISPYCQKRSVNVELDLEAGEYTLLLKINAVRCMKILPIEEVIRSNARDRRDKLVAVGMSYDLAHSKGKFSETDAERKAREDIETSMHEAQKRELKEKLMNNKRREHYFDMKAQKKRRERAAKAKEKSEAKAKKGCQPPSVESTPATNQDIKQTQTPPRDSEDGIAVQPRPVSSDSASDSSFKTPSGSESSCKATKVTYIHSSSDESELSSPSDISDQELEYQLESRTRIPPPIHPTEKKVPDTDETEDEFESNPWNAVATVGLRIYYKVLSNRTSNDENVKLRVVRTVTHAKESKDDEAAEKNEMGLDVDDSSKDATLVGDQQCRKKSIAPFKRNDV